MAMRTLARREHLEFTGLSRNLLRLAIAAALSAAAALPLRQAQETPEALGDIVVTGIRVGIENAIETKRESTQHRRGGLGRGHRQAARHQHRGVDLAPAGPDLAARGRPRSAISLRGTDPGFTTALLNGREQVSTGDNRSVEFDQYPSELLSAVIVYKTPDSQLVGQGLAGTIDLRTHPPARLRQARDRGQLPRRAELERQPRRELGRQRLPRQLLLHRPVHGRQASASPSGTRISIRRWRRRASAPTSPWNPTGGGDR